MSSSKADKLIQDVKLPFTAPVSKSQCQSKISELVPQVLQQIHDLQNSGRLSNATNIAISRVVYLLGYIDDDPQAFYNQIHVPLDDIIGESLASPEGVIPGILSAKRPLDLTSEVMKMTDDLSSLPDVVRKPPGPKRGLTRSAVTYVDGVAYHRAPTPPAIQPFILTNAALPQALTHYDIFYYPTATLDEPRPQWIEITQKNPIDQAHNGMLLCILVLQEEYGGPSKRDGVQEISLIKRFREKTVKGTMLEVTEIYPFSQPASVVRPYISPMDAPTSVFVASISIPVVPSLYSEALPSLEGVSRAGKKRALDEDESSPSPRKQLKVEQEEPIAGPSHRARRPAASSMGKRISQPTTPSPSPSPVPSNTKGKNAKRNASSTEKAAEQHGKSKHRARNKDDKNGPAPKKAAKGQGKASKKATPVEPPPRRSARSKKI
ncbi:hypothetical protein C8J56DRAFT_899633 [Mycena floridula]|nr:hypothetical protein C8J56DRAFT_899633 [Mycena floridula]